MSLDCYLHQNVRRDIDCNCSVGVEVHRLMVHLERYDNIQEEYQYLSIPQKELPRLLEALIPLVKEMYPEWEPPCS